jgi:prophage regulatory protein
MKMLRLPEVMEATGLSRATVYRLERKGEFPKRRRLGVNSVGWVEAEVTTWMQRRPAVLDMAPMQLFKQPPATVTWFSTAQAATVRSSYAGLSHDAMSLRSCTAPKTAPAGYRKCPEENILRTKVGTRAQKKGHTTRQCPRTATHRACQM